MLSHISSISIESHRLASLSLRLAIAAFLILSFPHPAASDSLAAHLISLDHQLLAQIQSNNQHRVFDYIFESTSMASPFLEGGYIIANVIKDDQYRSKKTFNQGLMDASILAGTQIVNLSLKYAIKRDRPNLEEKGYKPRLFNSRVTPSFPSGHAASSFAFAAIIWEERPRYRILALTYALVSGYAQLYVGNHYPSDVVAGAVLGFGIGMLANKFR